MTPAATLDDRKSLSIAFLAFQINTQLFLAQNDPRRPFWMTENHFRSHVSPFRINAQFDFFNFHKIVAGGHFGWPKITFDRISRNYRSIRNFYFFYFTKWLPASILDDRKSLLIAFLAISDQYAAFWKSDLGHFGWAKITFDRISRNFSSISITWVITVTE